MRPRARSLCSVIAVVVFLTSVLSCAGAPDPDPATSHPVSDAPPDLRISVPVVTPSVPAGAPLRAPVSGIVAAVEEDTHGRSRVVLSTEQQYYWNGSEQSTQYQLVIGGLERATVQPGPVRLGDQVGVASEQSYVTARHESLDRWLVRNAVHATHLDGYWWFDPVWLDPHRTRFLSFRPIDDIHAHLRPLVELAEREATSNRDRTELLFQYIHGRDRVRVATSLPDYPESFQPGATVNAVEMQFYHGTGNIQSRQVWTEVGGWTVTLYWQQGFRRYLREEYTPGEPIWLYMSVYAFDQSERNVIVFVRDFAIRPDEEVIPARTRRFLEEEWSYTADPGTT